MVTCPLHPEHLAVGVCERCGHFLCDVCVGSSERRLCQACQQRTAPRPLPSFFALWWAASSFVGWMVVAVIARSLWGRFPGLGVASALPLLLSCAWTGVAAVQAVQLRGHLRGWAWWLPATALAGSAIELVDSPWKWLVLLSCQWGAIRGSLPRWRTFVIPAALVGAVATVTANQLTLSPQVPRAAVWVATGIALAWHLRERGRVAGSSPSP